MDNHFEHCSAHVTSLEQDGFLVKIYAQIPSDSGVSGRELLSRIDQISGHLRRVKCCESISRGQLAFARIDDNFHRVRALGDNVEGRVAVRFIDYGHEDVLLLSDIIVVDPPLSDMLTTVRPLAEDFYLDGILLLRPLSNEEIVVLSEKILYQTVSCRLRRLHPELSLIELAATNAAGDRCELFSNVVIELGFGKKCSSEDIAKYLRIKIPTRADDASAMQSGRPFATNPYSVPPPSLLGSQAPTMLGSPPTSILGSQATTMLGTHSGITQISQSSSVNSRLTKFKKDAALNITGSGVLYGQASSPPPQLADRKQYAVTDGRTCTTAPTLPVKSTHNAYISHVEDGPFSFTIQLKSSVEDLLPKLRNILVRYQNSPITAQLIPGSVVMAKSSDETLRRGVIMNVQPETCKVYYIDFGHFEELPYSDIFQLPNTAAELSPAMAMQFCLSDLKSMKITDSNKDYFARLLLGKQVLIRVTERESNSPFQYCEIMWEGRSVREILLNLNSPMQYSYQYPPRGREAPVSVIYVDGPSQFFVQYRSELNVVNQIQEALASYCPSQPRVTDLSSICIGSPVASMFPDDQRWYRALVMGMDSACVNVFYVDYGNRAEVTPNQICLLSRDLVNKWKTQAIECCLIGFDTVSPDLYMAEKMEETALGRSYTLRLHSILSGFRLSVDLLDEQGNSVATNMKNLLNERQKAVSQPPTRTEKKKPQTSQDDDRSSQHSSDSVRMAIGVYEPPPAQVQKYTKSGDSGGHKNKYQRPGTGTRGDRGNKVDQRGDRKFDDRNKFEERQTSYSQHDDRSGNDYKPRNDARNDWKKGAKKPHMDQVDEWDNSNQEPKPFTKKSSWGDKQDAGGGGFKKQEWKSDDKVGWSGDSSNRGSRPDRGDRQGGGGFRSDGDRQGGGFRSDGDRTGGSSRFDRKPFNNDVDGRNGERGDSWGSRDRKFGDRDNKFGDRDNKFGDRSGRDSRHGGDREHKFGDRENRYGSRENKFGDRDNKFGNRDKPFNRENRKPKWNVDDEVQRAPPAAEETWDNGDAEALVKRPSVVISEYPHQEIKVGGEYKVLFAVLESSVRDVYVQLSDCDPELDKIRNMIDADTTATSRPCSNPVLAMPVLARFQDDGMLYRATIKSISKLPTGQVDILFVDFGNKAVNALSEVFTISSELMSIPIQAIHVIVTDMPSVPSANLEACQAHFYTDYLTLKPSRTTTVNLEQVIEGLLIRPDGHSVADCIKNDPSCNGEVQMVAETVSKLASSEVFESQAQTVEVESHVPGSVVLWRERLDLLRNQLLLAKVVKKCKDDNVYLIKVTAVLDLIVLAQSVDTLSSELVQGADVIVAVVGLAKDRLLVNYYNRQGQSLGKEDAIGSIAPMQIVQRKGIFTISHKEASKLYLQHEDSTTLSDLLESLFEKYEDSDFDNNEFKAGDLCAAKSLDGNWYRAKISTVVENVYTVHYLDYGNSEEMKVENLRKLSEEFSSPEICVSVVLPVTYKDMECVETLGEGPFECTFIQLDSLNGVWIVDLRTIGEVNENLALKWIEAGKAESMSDVPANPKQREPWWNLKKGDRVPVIISHFDFPDVFYAHHLEQSSDLEALQDKIQDLPEGGDLGEVFVAKYTDSIWYRAVRVGDQVRFLDYGNSDLSVETKSLPASLIHPAKGYAMPLRLCVRANGDQWSEPAGQLFEDFIDKSGLEAEIISADFETIVDLRVGDESLATNFVDKGFAVPLNTPLNDVVVDCVIEDELPVGKVPAFVTSMTSINNFYIQEMSRAAVLDLLMSRLEAADSYEVIEKPSLGQYLVAKFIDDSIWYRAKVINHDPVEVLFLDYGNVSPATEFRVLPFSLAAFPSLAWHCSVNIDDSLSISDQFTTLVDANTVFDVNFVERRDDLHVVQLSIDNKNPFELSSVLENVKTDIPPSTVELSDEVQVKPIPPALTKSFYKDCVLCHSNGPYDFYVQTDDDHIQIDEMANALFEAGAFPKVDLVKKGDFVVAQFTEDDAYYRAIVTDVEPEIVVHFIDYGNSSPASCFHELPSALKKIPQLAVRCSLQSPIGGWSVDAIDKFTSLLNSEANSINLKIISRGDPTTVDVEINGSSITKQLSSDVEFEPPSVHEASSAVNDEPHLQSSGLCYIASATSKECYIHDSSSSADLDFITEQLASIDVNDANCELKDVKVGDLVGACHDGSLYRARITKLDPPEVYFVDYGNESPVTQFFKLPNPVKSKKPLAMKVKLDLGDGVELNDDGVVELQNLAVDGANYTQTRPSVVELTVEGSKVADLLKSYLVISDPNSDSPKPNASSISPPTTEPVKEVDFIPITISHVNSPSDFYYQVDLTKVNEMSSRLSEAEGFSSIEKCEIGQVICGKYSEDEQWYRAKILTTEPINVLFLDYGNTSEVQEMKQLPDDLAKIPALSVKASLKTQDRPWTEDEASKFLEIAYGDANFTCSVIENGADSVIVRLNSSEIGDVTTYLGRSCSLMTSESEYGTPEVLSVEDIIPPDHNDQSAVVDSCSSSQVDLQIDSSINLVLGKETPLQPIDHFAEHSQVQSETVELKIQNVLSSETVSVSPDSKPSCVISAEDDYKKSIIGSEESDHLASSSSVGNYDELQSTDMLTVQAKSPQSSPTKNPTAPKNSDIEDSKDVAVDKGDVISKEDMSYNVMVASYNDAESILTSPESDSSVRENIEVEERLRLGKQSPIDANVGPQNEPLAECKDVEVSQANTLDDQFKKVASPSTGSPSIVKLEAPINDNSTNIVEQPPALDISSAKSDVPVPFASDESQMYFRLPNLKETLFSVIGYESSLVTKLDANTPSKIGEENDPCEVMNSSTEVQASTSLYQLAESNESYERLNDESYFSNTSVSSLPPALVETIEGQSTENVSSDVDGSLVGLQQSDLKTELDVNNSIVVEDTGIMSLANSYGLEKSAVSEEHDVACVEPASKLPALTTTENEENITVPSLEDLKTELDGTSSLVLVDPLISGNITTLPNPPGGCEVSVVPEERQMAFARPMCNNPVLSTTNGEENSTVPSHVMEKSGELKTELDVNSSLVGGDPVVSGNITSSANPDGREKSAVSEERDVAYVQLVSSVLAPTTTENEENITVPSLEDLKTALGVPSQVIEKSEELKTELDVNSSLVGGDPVVSGNITSSANPDGREKSAAVSEEHDVAYVQLVSSDLAPTTTEVKKNSPTRLVKPITAHTTTKDVENIQHFENELIVENSAVVKTVVSVNTTTLTKIGGLKKLTDSGDGEVVSEDIITNSPVLTTTKDEENITVPSDLTEKYEDLKTKIDVVHPIPVVVQPVVSENSTTLANTKGVEVTTASRKGKANVKPASKISSTVTEPSKRIPVKTLAQIKASAKPRISTGRPASSNLKNKSSSESSSPSTPLLGRKLLASPTASSQPPHSGKDRIIPGTVNGSEI